VIYSGMFLLMALGFNFVWRYAAHKNRLLDPNANIKEVKAITGQYRLGPLFYVFTFALAFVLPLASIVLELLLAIYFALPGRRQPE